MKTYEQFIHIRGFDKAQWRRIREIMRLVTDGLRTQPPEKLHPNEENIGT